LKSIYNAPTLEAGERALDEFADRACKKNCVTA
jgi:hypothetical protein